jgi:hypothetical protein
MSEPEINSSVKENALTRIKRVISSGITSRDEIAAQTKLNAKHVRKIIRKNNLLPRKRDQTIGKLRELYDRGLTLQQAAREMSTAPANIRARVQAYDLNLPFLSPQLPATDENVQVALTNADPDERGLVRAILQGNSLPKIGKHFDFTSEYARQYIKDHQLRLLWQKARTSAKQHTEAKELHHARENFLPLLEKRFQQQLNSPDFSWSEKKSAEYIHDRSWISCDALSPQRIFKVYHSYEKAKSKGNKISFKSIGREAAVSPPVAWSLLKKAGCVSLNWTVVQRHSISAEKKAKIREASLLEISLKDLEYFSGLSSICFIRYGTKRKPHTTYIKSFGSSPPRLTYRLASQIYEAEDLGFTPPQIQELFGITEAHVNYVSANRMEIQRPIMKALQIFHPEREITKPYFSKDP